MTISLIINTCALGPSAGDVWGSGGKSPVHAWRAYALRNFILPYYQKWLVPRGFAGMTYPGPIKELIVVGEWEPCPEATYPYKYIHCPSQYRNCADALVQRQAGFEASTGSVLIFQHDDHILDEPFIRPNRDYPLTWWKDWDVFIPQRWTRLRNVMGEKLNNGEDKGYISGHCAIYKREILERAPWGNVPKVFTWDIEHTKQLLSAGAVIEWSSALRMYDVEMGARPWM